VTPELPYLGAVDALAGFRAHTLSPVELMEATIARAEATEPAVNAFTDRYWSEALDAARVAETRWARGQARALEGLPVAMKDELPIRGQRCTDGSLLHAEEIADHTHPAAERVLAAGGIVHARTTTPEFCCAGFTHSRLWGVTRSPWDVAASSGGSSGGSGAALAAGSATLATGSDIGGSIRIPAAFNGVVGFKPPYGRVPDLPAFNLDHYCQNGPMARTVADCALLQNVLAGPHRDDVATLRPVYTLPERLPDVRGWRIALSLDLGGYDVHDEVAACTRDAAEALREAGAIVEEVALPWDPLEIRRVAMAHYGRGFGAVMAEQVAEHRELLNPYVVAFAQESVRAAQALPPSAVGEAEARVYAPLAELLERYRVLLCPTVAVPAFPAGEDFVERPLTVDGRTYAHHFDACMTVPFNVVGRCPVISVPSGITASGVPAGVQFVGRTFDDESVFAAALAHERARPLWASGRRPSLPEGGQ
jgi:aspartyl-tRNA(Asn)/glutamyl-tRNA(Gln) amidotransferase subunit A